MVAQDFINRSIQKIVDRIISVQPDIDQSELKQKVFTEIIDSKIDLGQLDQWLKTYYDLINQRS